MTKCELNRILVEHSAHAKHEDYGICYTVGEYPEGIRMTDYGNITDTQEIVDSAEEVADRVIELISTYHSFNAKVLEMLFICCPDGVEIYPNYRGGQILSADVWVPSTDVWTRC